MNKCVAWGGPRDELPKPGSRWRHSATKEVFTVLDVCNKAANKIGFPPIVAYYDEHRNVWALTLFVWEGVMSEIKE